ncbi:MAG: FMN-binding glutamate synthase family protein [Nevskiaceae bacterium]|nr:MAG: FMN-binding glutamate synthase family protein [Nevskiaceae bacterium]
MSLSETLPVRYGFFAACLLVFALSVVTALMRPWPAATLVAAVTGLLTAVGVLDLGQRSHAIRRNYPILAHIRFFLEFIRPEIRQYFLETDTEETPFSRAQRSLVYQRAKNVLDKRPYGTQLQVYDDNYEWINHSMNPVKIGDANFRVVVGGGRCAQPYAASVLNISAMSFGALSANAIRALNRGARAGGFAHDTGEGSISRYHREFGGDLIWEIGSGYFGCRNDDGSFNADKFAANACDPQVKMIEIKISQGAKPGHGGVLPGAKVSREIALTRGVPEGVDCVSPARHSAFSTPTELLQFIARLRELSGGKPVGFKYALGHPWEFFAICKAMIETGEHPDFIVVDGGEGGTGAAPVEFTDHVGTPLQEALLLTHNTLVGLRLRDRVRIGASGKIISAFDIARTMALGADWCNSARGFMFAVGCLQAQACHTDHCPTGVATQDPLRQRALVVDDKAQRVHNFHRNTLKALAELVGAAGLSHPNQLRPHHIVRRVSANEVRLVSNLIPFLKPGDLLDNRAEHPVYAYFWKMADSRSFAPNLR